MKFTLRGASGVALIAGLVGGASAWAQETSTPATVAAPEEAAPVAQEAAPQVVEQTPPQAAVDPEPQAGERIVITGTLIPGASEDAPLPVEVYDLEQLTAQGAPTAAEFLRSLTISSEAFGEADSQIAGAAAGLATINLRGLGVGRTLVLLNGNRFNSGAITDVNTLPTMAIGRIDVLKDGASVTYGAGAVGGVVNYITRKNFEGVEVNVEKKFFDGSDGEDKIEALWGLRGENGNLLIAGAYGKRHPLQANERDYAQLPFSEQPANWTTFSSNPSQYLLAGTTTLIRDYTAATCTAIGGQRTGDLNNAAINPNDCAIPLYDIYNLIDEEIYTRGYIEYNGDLSDTMEFHFEAAYSKTENPNIWTGNSLPNGGNVAQLQGGGFSVPYQSQVYTAAGLPSGTVATNPFAEEFFNRAAANGLYTGARGSLDTASFFQWRPLMFGPNDFFPGGRRTEKQTRERWGGAIGVSGDFARDSLFGQWLPDNTTYAFSAYYNQYQQESTRPDWIVSRLQNALNGYGGPNCRALDRAPTDYTSAATYDATIGIQSDTAPGTNGCLYFNPFASSFETSFINGAANPAYGGAAFENSEEMLRWLTHDRRFENTNSALTFNATFTGEIPNYELPGGSISWAVGSEWRQTETRGTPLGSQEEIEIAGLRCPWDDDMSLAPTVPGLNACYADRGPFFSSGLGAQRPFTADRQVLSFYGELQFPVLENLNVQLAGRTEDYGPVRGDIWKIAAKYDVLPELSFRASYSTNFQAPPDDLGASGVQQGTAYVGSLFRSVSTTTITADGITPEDDKAANIGVIWSPEVLGGQLRMGFDLWEIVIDKEVGDTALSNVFQSVFGTSSPTATSLARCNAAFIGLVTFTEACNDTAPTTSLARTTGADLLNVTRFTLNTGGFITNGFDFSVDYTREVGPGDLYLAISGTDVMTYKVKGYNLPDGTQYQADFDGLGWANLTRGGTIMPRWRANGTIGYSLGEHRMNLRANYISGFRDDTGTPLGTGQTTVVGRVGTTNIFPEYGISAKDYLDFDLNYIYTAPFWRDLELRLSVLNIFDKDPMPAQHTNAAGVAQDSRTGYYPGYGNPRGRQIEIGVRKTF